MHARTVPMAVVAAATLLAAGCQRLNVERSYTLTPGEIQMLEIDAPRYEQKLTVTVTSPGSPVSVFLVRQEESKAARANLDADKPPTAPLASKEKAENITLEATVPAKTACVLLIHAVQKANVQVKVTGR